MSTKRPFIHHADAEAIATAVAAARGAVAELSTTFSAMDLSNFGFFFFFNSPDETLKFRIQGI